MAKAPSASSPRKCRPLRQLLSSLILGLAVLEHPNWPVPNTVKSDVVDRRARFRTLRTYYIFHARRITGGKKSAGGPESITCRCRSMVLRADGYKS
jgi:hypothetical protein